MNERIIFTVDASETASNCFAVSMNIECAGESFEISFPAWTPGSYVIRDFAGEIFDLEVTDNSGRKRPFEKIDKSTWLLHAERPVVKYKVHAHIHSVRNSFVDDDHLTLNGASAFPYVRNLERVRQEVNIIPRKGWNSISSGLERSGPWSLVAPDYDTLIDSPIEVGNQRIHKFNVRGKEHELAIFGNGNIEEKTFVSDLKKIVAAEVSIMGDMPYERYVFIYHLIPKTGGGLEHLNSTHIVSDPFQFRKREDYLQVLSIFSHEFFHLWNVKRLRPKPLGPFDYTKENYTTLLWFSEGITDYYAMLALRKAGVSNTAEFLKELTREIETYNLTPGRLHQSAAESSFDTWIKFYRRTENSVNSTISYYNKGLLIGALLDIRIASLTDGKKRLQDLMRLLYDRTYRRGSWFEEKDFLEAYMEISGENPDKVYTRLVKERGDLPLQQYLRLAGLKLLKEEEKKSCFGIILSRGEPLHVEAVIEGLPAYSSHVFPGDEITALNGIKMTPDNIRERVAELEEGKNAELIVFRDGRTRKIDIHPVLRPPKFKIEKIEKADTAARNVFEVWTYAKWKEKLDLSAIQDPSNYAFRNQLV
ncbi:MAG: hypothetical protein QXP70_05530 [Methanomassiliicoccales archaeon]